MTNGMSLTDALAAALRRADERMKAAGLTPLQYARAMNALQGWAREYSLPFEAYITSELWRLRTDSEPGLGSHVSG